MTGYVSLSHGCTRFGTLLLSNSRVQTDREILTILVNLPVYQGDAYRDVRENARMHLVALGS